MTEFQLEKPNYTLNTIEFQCDKPLANHIKEPFPNKSFFMLIVGKPGSGKTSLLLNMLTMKGQNKIYKHVFDKILLVMPKNSRGSIKNNPFEDLPPDQVFDEMGPDVLKKIEDIKAEFDELNEKKPRVRNQLLILDDVTAYLKDNAKTMVELSTNRRHLKLSILLLVQFIRSVPRPVRLQITDLIIFKPANELETAIVEEEFINMKKDKFQDLCRFVFTNQHDFLMLNKNDEKYYKNLQRISNI